MKADGPKISNLMVHEFESKRSISMRVSGSKPLYLSFKYYMSHYYCDVVVKNHDVMDNLMILK